MKFLYIIPLSLSALIGLFINASYYRTGFLNNGYIGYYPLILAIAFILFEAVLWLYINKNAAITALKVSILIFSVNITLGAQFFSTSTQEAETTDKIFKTLDTSGMVQHYLDQIAIQNNRIDSIYRDRENDNIYTLSEDSLIAATAEKSKYEKLLLEAQGKKETAVKKINSPKTIYKWMAEDMPLIFRSGWTENLVRIIQQLFSSILLALMAPVSLSLIRKVIDEDKAKTSKPNGIGIKNKVKELIKTIKGKLKSKKPEDLEIIDIDSALDNTKWPRLEEIKPDPTPTVKTDLEYILEMLLYYYPDNGILSPEKSAEWFIDIHKKKPWIKSFTKKECEKIYNKILPFNGMDKEDIKMEGLK